MIVYEMFAPRGREFTVHDLGTRDSVAFLTHLRLVPGEKVIIVAKELSREAYDAIPATSGEIAAKEVQRGEE